MNSVQKSHYFFLLFFYEIILRVRFRPLRVQKPFFVIFTKVDQISLISFLFWLSLGPKL